MLISTALMARLEAFDWPDRTARGSSGSASGCSQLAVDGDGWARVGSRREDFARTLRTGTAISVREAPAMLTGIARDGRGRCGRLVQSVLGTDQERSIAAVLGSFI
jgi:hypothetical protein